MVIGRSALRKCETTFECADNQTMTLTTHEYLDNLYALGANVAFKGMFKHLASNNKHREYECVIVPVFT